MNIRRFIGDKAFYRSVLTLLIPIIVQQFISSFVSLLDNVMVGSLGKESISAASIANQVMMVFNLAIFGGLSGVSIFGAQFYGKGDMTGMRYTFRVKLFFGVMCSVAAIVIYLVFGEAFIASFLRGESNGGDPVKALREGTDYLRIMLWGLPPFALVQIYAGTLRESGETVAPMKAGIIAILTNLFLNWVLIFGNLGMQRRGNRDRNIPVCRAGNRDASCPPERGQIPLPGRRLPELPCSREADRENQPDGDAAPDQRGAVVAGNDVYQPVLFPQRPERGRRAEYRRYGVEPVLCDYVRHGQRRFDYGRAAAGSR